MRLSRYWVFIALSYLVAIGAFIFTSVLHTFGSSVSASVSVYAPRYNFAGIGFYYLAIFIIGIIFLAFDVRARDERERMIEVLDSRPFTNLDLVIGRFIGLFLSAWIPVILLVLLIQCLGWLLPLFGSPFVSVIEPFSLFSFPVFNALPAMMLSCSLVLFITLLMRNRFISLLVSIALITGLFTLSIGIVFPFATSSTMDLMGFTQSTIASDWVPEIARNSLGWWQRVGVLMLSTTLLFAAALAHPRLDGVSRMRSISIVLAGIFLSASLLVSVFVVRNGETLQIQEWREAHQAASERSTPDIISMQASVDIKPGNRLDVGLELVLKAPKNVVLESALFSLNPGYESLIVNDSLGNSLTSKFENGLLDIQLPKPLEGEATSRISLNFHGRPNILFGYLDSRIDIRNIKQSEASVTALGIDNAIFDERYIALMPGIHWLPRSGTDFARADTTKNTSDFYNLELTVRVPLGWTVAGPGQRKETNRSQGEVEFVFAPTSSISETAIFTAPFKSIQSEISGISFEVLIHPKHAASIDYLAQSKGQIKSWIGERLSLASEAGLNYPYRAFTLVEVPNRLRGFKGGWQMDTALAPPSMVLMKESALPEARFDFDPQSRPEKEQKDGEAIVLRNRLIEFYKSDFTGGNVFTGIAKSFYSHQLAAHGEQSIALDYTLNQLATLVFSGERSYFSASKFGIVFQSAGNTLGSSSDRARDLSERVLLGANSDEVWEIASKVPLVAIQSLDDAGLVTDLLALKAGGMAELIYDILGPVRSGNLLAKLVEEHRGSTYSKTDLVVTIRKFDVELAELIESWFDNTELAGFMAQKTELYQLPDSVNGDTRYQLSLQIKNNENVAGYTRVSWQIESEAVKARSKPFRVAPHSTVEFSVILSRPPQEVHIEPYVALNRSSLLVKKFNRINIEKKNAAIVQGVREIVTKAESIDRLIVDDLDTGFSINKYSSDEQQYPHEKTITSSHDNDIALVKSREFPIEWSRLNEDSAWAKYRHTLMFISPGSGDSRAHFSTKLPKLGLWQLEIHMPRSWFSSDNGLGDWEMEIVSNNVRQAVSFDATASVEGWNVVGQYDLPKELVTVVLSNKTNGRGVIADAISWSLAE